MDFYMKLPRNKKEMTLFIAIISIISVNIIAPLITCFEFGFHMSVWKNALKIMPFIWMSVVVLVLLTSKPADWLTMKIVEKEDSFGAHMVINALCTVFLMSIFLTIIGTWIGTGSITLEPFLTFFYKWPRNFSISLAVEVVVAQPIARLAMLKLHQMTDREVVE